MTTHNQPGQANLIVVAGVPGAGKSTALREIAAVAEAAPGLRILDSDIQRHWLAARLPARTPYGWYRPCVHLAHQVSVAGQVVAGPNRRDGRPRRLIVHDPGTRPWWRRGLVTLARVRGWRAELVFVEVSRREALGGQLARGRVVREASFEAHWHRGQRLAAQLRRSTMTEGGWQRAYLTSRAEAVGAVCAALGIGGGTGGSVGGSVGDQRMAA